MSSRAASKYFMFICPLCTGHMAQPDTDQYESKIAVRKTPRHASAAEKFPVQSFNDIIGADTGPLLAGKIAVGQCFFNVAPPLAWPRLSASWSVVLLPKSWLYLEHLFCFPGRGLLWASLPPTLPWNTV